MESECHNVLTAFQQSRVWDASSVAQTDRVLGKIVQDLRPPTQEWQARQAVIGRLQSVLTWMPDFQAVPSRSGEAGTCLARILVFGSFCTTLYHKGSDLDLTITGQWRNRHGKLLDLHTMHPGDIADMLHRIKRSLINHRVSTDAMVINARVPLVMYTDAESGVQVDISVCNHSGVFKCRFIKMMTQFDDRFEALYRLVKLWAECKNLNDPKAGTLNSWSLTQMVVFHLQNCKPAILPPLWLFFHNEPQHGPRPLEQQEQQPDNTRLRQQQQPVSKSGAPYELLPQCDLQRQRYQSMYNKNSGCGGDGQGITELLAGFFVRYHQVFRQWISYQRHSDTRMSTWLGRWDQGSVLWRHEYLVCMEDPFDSHDNTARTLGTQSRNDGGGWRILRELQQASEAVSTLRSQQDIHKLVALLFHKATKNAHFQPYSPTGSIPPQQQQEQANRQQQHQQQGHHLQQHAQIFNLNEQMQQMALSTQHHSLPGSPLLQQLQQAQLQVLQQQQQQQQHRNPVPAVQVAGSEDSDEYARARALVASALTNLHWRQPTALTTDLTR